MKCPHCSTVVRFEVSDTSQFYRFDAEARTRNPGCNGYDTANGFCPECEGLIVMLRKGAFREEQYGYNLLEAKQIDILFPKFSTRPVEPEVPLNYGQDFAEAIGVLGISPKASAALSRRILQQILRDELGVKPSTLSSEIDEFISQRGVPSHLSGAVDAVRNIGNFAAHPLKDTQTGAVAEVEPGEGEWLLDVLEALFDFAFVQPTRLAAKQKQLNAKLASMGKPNMKGT